MCIQHKWNEAQGASERQHTTTNERDKCTCVFVDWWLLVVQIAAIKNVYTRFCCCCCCCRRCSENPIYLFFFFGFDGGRTHNRRKQKKNHTHTQTLIQRTRMKTALYINSYSTMSNYQFNVKLVAEQIISPVWRFEWSTKTGEKNEEDEKKNANSYSIYLPLKWKTFCMFLSNAAKWSLTLCTKMHKTEIKNFAKMWL